MPRSFICSFVVCLSLVPALAAAADRPEVKLHVSELVLEEFRGMRDAKFPDSLFEKARCVAIIPSVIKGAFGVGGHHGRGVISCKHPEGGWTPPIFLSLSGASVGWQVGGESSDVLLFFMNERGVRSLLSSRFTLGADATVAAGPLGRSAEASTDLKLNAEIYSYARSKGLFAGVALEGARLAPDKKRTRGFYGQPVDPERALFEGDVPSRPEGVESFLEALP